MTSRMLIENDTEMNLASPLSAPRRYGDIPLGSLDLLEPVDGGTGDDLPQGPVGERDRSLVAAAIATSEDGTEVVMVVSDDEALADWIAEIAAGMSDIDVNILSGSSVDVLGRMHECGTIGIPVVTAISDAETDHLNERIMPAGLRQRKLNRLNQMVVAAAAREAKRDA